MKPKNYGKDISSVTTPIKFYLPDGSSQSFQNSTEAQQWFNQNYGNGYSMVEYIPTQGDSDHPIQLQEVIVTAPAPKRDSSPSKRGIDMWAGANYSPRFNKYFYGTSDFDALFGRSRVEGVRKAWQRNPQAMQNWTDGGNAAAAFVTAPFAIHAAGEYVLPWLAENVAPYLTARGWLAATQATGSTPAWLTPTTATAIDATLAGSATGASINDMRENGPTVGNVLGTALGVGGLAYEAAPTLMESYTVARNAVRPTIVGMKMRTMPLGEVETPTLTPQMRYRLGDVEINDPNLNYRQGARGTADDFLQSGKVRVKYEGADAAKRERKPGRLLLTKSFNNPMFKQGGLWYDGWLMNEPGAAPGMPDLLVTRQPLRFATKGAGPAKADLGGRRIPFSEDQLGLGNTTAYSWQDGYGFRRIKPGTTELPSEAWDQVVTAVQNKPFIEAYNQWNRFGYPQVPKGMASDTPKLEAFVRGQLNRHNTFSRGVQVMPSDKTALESQLGRRLTDDEFLRIAATTPRMEGEVGQPGLWISPRTDYTSIYGGGRTALVRRPFKLGPDRMKWFEEASFNVQHNPGAEGSYTEIMAPWNTKPVLNWNGVPKYSVGTSPETELLSPTRMEFVDFVKGSPHMNNRTSLNSNPFFTKGENRSRIWAVDYKYLQEGRKT